MLRTLVIAQLKSAPQAVNLRLWAAAVVAAQVVLLAAARPNHPADAVEWLTWTQLFSALVAGGFLTGWRVAQWPKSRAAEFYLVTPVGDAAIVAGEMAGGMIRTALVVLAGAPAVCAAWGAGWIGAAEAVALLAIPLAGGWLAGAGLAVAAYEPLWVRRWIERLVLCAILAYFVLFGLAGNFLFPWVVRNWSTWTNTSVGTIADVDSVMRFFNPFRLLGTLGQPPDAGFAWRVAAVCGLLGGAWLLCFARLAIRLRPHYLEENYSPPRRRKRRQTKIGDSPLSWWTARRVTRFKGNVNLYLTWSVICLYCAWMFLGDRWPAWLGSGVLQRIEGYGGAALLAVAALQLALVGVAFLDGLWDSNMAQRLGRLELLLVTPLSARDYLAASAVAGWTRGRSYVLAALLLWIAAGLNGRVSWPTCLALCIVGGTYGILIFAVAFRNFGRVAGDRVAAAWGLALSVGLPLATWILLASGWTAVAAATPLGAIFLLALSPAEYAAFTRLPPDLLWLVAAVANAAILILSCWLLIAAGKRFESTMRASFSAQR